MAGDLLLFAMDLGEEGSASYWCRLLFVGRKIMNGRRKRIFFPLASVRCRKEKKEVFYLTKYFKEHPGLRIELVDVTVSIDHGKGFSRAALVVIVCCKEDNEWNEKEESFFLASARCRK